MPSRKSSHRAKTWNVCFTNEKGSLNRAFRLAFRLLLRAPGFSVIGVLTLAAGMSATTLVFTLINAVVLRPLPIHQPDRVLALSTTGEMAFLQQEPLAFGDYLDLMGYSAGRGPARVGLNGPGR